MTSEALAWRVDDTAAYDTMRDVANALIARLLTRERENGVSADAEISQIRSDVAVIDGYNRSRVHEQTETLLHRIKELGG